MRQIIAIFIAVLAFVGKPILIYSQILQVKTNKKYSIPFQLSPYNSIIIKAILNNIDTVNLMLHTASADVTITEESFSKLKTVKFQGSVDSVKSWGGSLNSSEFSKNNSLEIGNLNWNDITIWKDKNSGQGTDGKFGLNLFENQILELDFNKNRLIVETKMPKKQKKFEKFQLISKNDGIFIKGVCKTEIDNFVNTFLIHFGYAGDVLFDDKFAGENKIGQQIKITGENKLKDAYGNVLTTKRGVLPMFILGKYQLVSLPVGFFEGAIGRQKISIIGGDIIKRFNWIIDVRRGYIYLKPNKNFSTKFSNE